MSSGVCHYVQWDILSMDMVEGDELNYSGYAKYILQREMLPHGGMGECDKTKKAYYFGCINRRLFLCTLCRRPECDRDHYGNKRLDLVVPLLGNLPDIVELEFSKYDARKAIIGSKLPWMKRKHSKALKGCKHSGSETSETLLYFISFFVSWLSLPVI
ncbi:hypothetical protein GIB67_017203 [Kingdonia uniflora]|uniref:RNA polymerase Rpb2 domain-containing protein n=1 Tax=Kingdonia uniflora TaxID=39325 RepID=A0A7J7NL97_9MAGN|nr:hypothetical protein GIB67_017203 [Kingdonia uniflora]